MAAGGMGAALVGCQTPHSFLEQSSTPDRAEYSTTTIAIPETPPITVVNRDPTAKAGFMADLITGTWNFDVPKTVTSVEHMTNDMHEYSLFLGRPQPTDKPFMVITVNHNRSVRATSDPEYKVTNDREYTMNGAIVHEWTGTTSTGAGFSELLLRKPGAAGETGDVCHAVAAVKNDDEQKLALSILSSLVWKPAK